MIPTERPDRPNYLALTVLALTLLILGLDRMGLTLLAAPATQLYSWAVVLSAFALLLGVANVGWVHLRRVMAGQAGWQHSLALLAALLVIFSAGMVSPTGVRSPIVEWLFSSIIAPGQAALFALLAFFMAGAAYRFLRVGRRGAAWVLAGVALVLMVQMPAAHALLPEGAATLVGWVMDVPAMAALRGVLLGSSFALLVIAFRFLLTAR
jgi:hypothetical protein